MRDLITKNEIYNAIEQVNGIHVAKYDGFYFESIFQPIVSPSSHCLGFEALVRIKELTTGDVINPYDFFQSFTSDIEATNFGSICFTIHVLNFSQSLQKTLKLFLNIMPIMFSITHNNPTSINDGLDIFNEAGLAFENVVLEITELKSHDLSGLSAGIEFFRTQGFSFAIDDFGVDSSNEERVVLLRPDFIKLDKSLLYNYMAHGDVTLIEAIALTKREGANVSIEGVETKEQLEILTTLGVDFVQGYYLGRPEILTCAKPTM